MNDQLMALIVEWRASDCYELWKAGDQLESLLARAEDPEQAAREPADVATTIYRKLGCVCQWEAGDSPCPVHDRFCVDDLAEGKEPTT